MVTIRLQLNFMAEKLAVKSTRALERQLQSLKTAYPPSLPSTNPNLPTLPLYICLLSSLPPNFTKTKLLLTSKHTHFERQLAVH